MIKTNSITFGFIPDAHYREDILRWYWDLGSGFDAQWREYSTASVRLADAITQFNASGCDLFLSGGDILDSYSDGFEGDPEDLEAIAAANLAAVLTLTDEFAGSKLAFALGNHEDYLYNTSLGGAIDDFWTTVDDGHNHVVRQNEFTPNGWAGPAGYTFDYEGFRFVIMWSTVGSISQDQLDWLYDGEGGGVLETTLPCIVVAHALIYPDLNPYAYAYVTNHADVRALFESSGTVIAVMQGHYHRSGKPSFGTRMINTVNGIPYFAFGGSILADNGVPGTSDDNNYYTIRVTPSTVDRMKSVVSVTGYKRGLSGVVPNCFIG